MTDTSLPAPFAALEPLVAEWALGSEEERCNKRLTSPIPKLRAFYDQGFPRIEAIIAYLNTFPNDPDTLPGPERRLFDLALMVMEAAAPLDLQWPSSDITDVFPIERFTFMPLSGG